MTRQPETVKMKKQTIIILSIVVLTIILWTSNYLYKKNSFDLVKENILTALEKYKATHSTYPADLNALNVDLSGKFYYYTDSTKQSYTLSYSKGIMDCNTITFDSKTKKWEEKFAY